MQQATAVFALLVSITFCGTVFAAPIVTPGAPSIDGFSTVDPGSLTVEMLGDGDMVATQISLTIEPLCIRPFEIDLETTNGGAVFENLTGILLNGCGGDSSSFDIKFTGDGLEHSFDILFVDAEFGGTLASLPVTLTAVPIPAAAWLFGSALLGLGAIKRKKT